MRQLTVEVSDEVYDGLMAMDGSAGEIISRLVLGDAPEVSEDAAPATQPAPAVSLSDLTFNELKAKLVELGGKFKVGMKRADLESAVAAKS